MCLQKKKKFFFRWGVCGVWASAEEIGCSDAAGQPGGGGALSSPPRLDPAETVPTGFCVKVRYIVNCCVCCYVAHHEFSLLCVCIASLCIALVGAAPPHARCSAGQSDGRAGRLAPQAPAELT